MNLNMDEKIQIRNLCNWALSFKRIDSIGDVLIPANSTMRVARGEVFTQAQSGNNLLLVLMVLVLTLVSILTIKIQE